MSTTPSKSYESEIVEYTTAQGGSLPSQTFTVTTVDIIDDYTYANVVLPRTTGTAVIYQGAKFGPFTAYEAELALDIGAEDTVVSQKIPIEFTSIIIKKTDNEFTDVNLRWNDYYPALGEKQVILQAIDRNGNLDTSVNNIKITYIIAPFDTVSLIPDPQYAAGAGTAIMINGIIIFKLNAQTNGSIRPSR